MNFSQRRKVNLVGTEVKTYAILFKITLAHIAFSNWSKWHSLSHCHDQSLQGQFFPLDYLHPSQIPDLPSSRPHFKIRETDFSPCIEIATLLVSLSIWHTKRQLKE